jgi:predicted RNA-binding Zn-ribbon protein involved in translation (DUF1610 family)
MPPALPDLPEDQVSVPVQAGKGSTQGVGEVIDAGKGRIFPCDRCGADLQFAIGTQHLKCPFCGYEKDLEFQPDAVVAEQDFDGMLVRLQELRRAGVQDEQQTSEVRCSSCGGQVVFLGTLTSTECPYCASPIQRENIHKSDFRVPVDGVLPFFVDHERAAEQLRSWVKSLWFAPNEFKAKGVTGKFQGVYEPYWTFDFETFTRYTGQRGDHYWVTVGSGKDQRREQRTNWTHTFGSFHRFFDDVLCFASKGLPEWMTQALEPWPLHECKPFNQQVLAGFLARTYDITIENGLTAARARAEAALSQDIRGRIGGDEQQILSQQTQYNAITYKHLLLPLWLLAYQYKGKLYQVAINGGTGEVQGERPYSAWKIFFAVLAGLITAAGGYFLSQQR